MPYRKMKASTPLERTAKAVVLLFEELDDGGSAMRSLLEAQEFSGASVEAFLIARRWRLFWVFRLAKRGALVPAGFLPAVRPRSAC